MRPSRAFALTWIQVHGFALHEPKLACSTTRLERSNRIWSGVAQLGRYLIVVLAEERQ